MKRDTLIGVTVLAVALAAVAAYALLRPLPAKAPGNVTDTSNLPAGSYAEHAQYYDIAANYATSTPLAPANPAADASAIALMKNWVADTIEQFKTDGGFAAFTNRDISMLGGRKETLQVVYLIASSPHTVSYIYTVYTDMLGAHGNTLFHTFMFDTRTGAPIALADLFTPGSPYLDTLSSIARSNLPAVIGEGAPADMLANGTTPDAKNFQNFFFDNKDFVLLFDPYQVAPYAAGPQTLRIPTSDLPGLRPDYR